MSRKHTVWRTLAALVLIGLLVAGGFAVYRVGWWQGYQMGQLAAGGEESARVRDLPFRFGFGYQRHGLWFPPFPFGGRLLFTVLLLILLFAGIGKLIRLWAWKVACGPGGGHWPGHWHGPYGPMHPRCQSPERPSEEQAVKVKPDAGTGDSET